jgi:hypothetical protein
MRSQQDVNQDLKTIFEVFNNIAADQDKRELIRMALEAINDSHGYDPKVLALRLRAWAPDFKADWAFAALHDAADLIELHPGQP